MKLLLLLLTLFINICVLGQNNVKQWDKAWSSKIKGKLKKIKVGKSSKAITIYYFKSNKSIFSVEKREFYKFDKNSDSAFSFSANFKNDTLFRVVIRKAVPLQKQGRIILYLDGNNILDQDIVGEIFLPEISIIKEKAYEMLLDAKQIIEAK